MIFSKTEQFFFDVAKPVAEALGCYVYDVEYTKEGGHFYMRILVDKDGGISIDECKDINHEIGKKIENNDPIKTNYFLEVSSPGVERKLRQAEHFEKYLGETVDVGLYKAVNGSKALTGKLLSYKEKEFVEIEINDENIRLELSEVTAVKLHFEF